MERKTRQKSSHPKRGDIIEPMKTFAQSDSAISAGTLVWAKLKGWPWWPGIDERSHSVIIHIF